MRPLDPTSLTSRVTARIARGRRDRLWTYADFTDLGVPATTLATILSRLARTRLLRRVRPGVYYRSATTPFGETKPDPEAVLDATLRRNRVRGVPTGLETWRRLGLTTQVAAVPTIATSRRHRLAPIEGHRVRARVRPPTPANRKDERAVLDALRSLDRISGVTPAEVLRRVLQLLRSEKIDATALAQMARLEPPRVRAMVGALIEEVRPEAVSSALLDVLRLSLNPATRYRIPAAAGQLSTAANWGIR